MMRLLISDANILIDMEAANLTATLFRLPYQFMTPDLLFYDELANWHGHLLEHGLMLGELTPEWVCKAQALAANYAGPSRYDCMALALAMREACPLITGDRALKKAASQEGVQVMGTIWLVEQMVSRQLLSVTQARVAFDRMKQKGSRLPWDFVERCLREWQKP